MAARCNVGSCNGPWIRIKALVEKLVKYFLKNKIHGLVSNVIPMLSSQLDTGTMDTEEINIKGSWVKDVWKVCHLCDSL